MDKTQPHRRHITPSPGYTPYDEALEDPRRINAVPPLAAPHVTQYTQIPSHVKIMAIALAYQGLPHRDIRIKLDLPPEALVLIPEWLKDPELVQAALQTGMTDVLKDQMKHKLLRNANVFIELALDPVKLQNATSLQLMTAAGIAITKALEMDGKTPPPSLQQININIDKTKDSIEILTQEEEDLLKKTRYLESMIANSATDVEAPNQNG